jgi:hypothetical protein
VANNINVTLGSQSPATLDVIDNGGQNQVPKNPQPQTITWHLTGEIAQGNFVPMSAPEPGFQWVDKEAPKVGIFTPATIGSGGNSLSIQDTHTDSSSSGEWIYKLRVQYQGQVYTTTHSLGPAATVNNPIIINKGP